MVNINAVISNLLNRMTENLPENIKIHISIKIENSDKQPCYINQKWQTFYLDGQLIS